MGDRTYIEKESCRKRIKILLEAKEQLAHNLKPWLVSEVTIEYCELEERINQLIDKEAKFLT